MHPRAHRGTEAHLELEPMVWASLSVNVLLRIPLCICILQCVCMCVCSVCAGICVHIYVKPCGVCVVLHT